MLERLNKAFSSRVEQIDLFTNQIVRRADAWVNEKTGLNTSRDKRTATRFMAGVELTDEAAESLYSDNDVAARICDAMPEFALQKGVSVAFTPDRTAPSLQEELTRASEHTAFIDEELERLGAVGAVTDNLVWANVFGFSAILINTGEQDLTKPLPSVGYDVASLRVFDKMKVSVYTYNTDITSPNYDKPELYRISASSGQADSFVHHSRLLVSEGIRTSSDRKQNKGGFSNSLLQRVQDVLMQFDLGWETLSRLIEGYEQSVFKMSGYIDALAQKQADLINDRISVMDQTRSVIRALVMDADGDDFQKIATNLSGISPAFDLLMYRLSLASKQPVSIIMGRSPAGMNATGDSDWQNVYSQVEIFRQQRAQPVLHQLVTVLVGQRKSPVAKDAKWRIQFDELHVQKPLERAQTEQAEATKYATLVNAGILQADEVAVSNFGPGTKDRVVIDVDTREPGADTKEPFNEEEVETDGEDETTGGE